MINLLEANNENIFIKMYGATFYSLLQAASLC